jgi:general secretion pathway protein F
MALFHYKAARASGEIAEGEMEAADQVALVRQLQRDGLIPIRIALASQGGGLFSGLFQRRAKTVSQDQILHFTRELATLLEAGLTLDRGLGLLADLSQDDVLVNMIRGLRERIQAGKPLSEALAAQGKAFSPLYVSTVRAGEAGGVLHKVLGRLASYLEGAQELRQTIRAALTYPMILFVVAGLSVTGLLMFVVPQFSQMFADMGQTLPLPTRVVIGIGDLLRDYWWALLALGFLAVAALQRLARDERWCYGWDRRLLKWPLVGDLVAKVETARFARTLGTLVGNGLPLLGALQLARAVIANRVIAESVQRASDHLKRGKGLADPLIEERILPPLALQMIKVGEESGDLEPMLMKVADVFDREVSNSVKQMLTLLEPVLIVGLGLIVVGIIVSILLPMLDANKLAM